MKKCPDCDKDIDKYMMVCDYCGKLDKKSEESEQSEKSEKEQGSGKE